MHELRFDHRIPCALPAAALLERLVEAVRDTDRAPFWPHELNRVVIPRWEEGCRFEATYRLGGLTVGRNPYVLAKMLPDAGFEYEAGRGHPFTGRISVLVHARPEGSELQWSGVYRMASWRPERLFFRRVFEPLFFPRLAQGLASLR
jgi:hypothetical protein